MDNVRESDVLVAVFFLGKVLGTYICALIFYSPSMQLTHWYGWGKLPNQQYKSSMSCQAGSSSGVRFPTISGNNLNRHQFSCALPPIVFFTLEGTW